MQAGVPALRESLDHSGTGFAAPLPGDLRCAVLWLWEHRGHVSKIAAFVAFSVSNKLPKVLGLTVAYIVSEFRITTSVLNLGTSFLSLPSLCCERIAAWASDLDGK